jgi:hypothetical protein
MRLSITYMKVADLEVLLANDFIRGPYPHFPAHIELRRQYFRLDHVRRGTQDPSSTKFEEIKLTSPRMVNVGCCIKQTGKGSVEQSLGAKRTSEAVRLEDRER